MAHHACQPALGHFPLYYLLLRCFIARDNIVVIIIWTQYPAEFIGWGPDRDSRVIIASRDDSSSPFFDQSQGKLDTFLGDWGPRRRNEPDMWELAEGMVKQQRTSTLETRTVVVNQPFDSS
ncbi:hypothetical protein C8J56DRAFT_1039454 [Mycena floridula]|nr:hypothetical protein C8J56DRAFT_1039454 [Mycena floridula]